MGNIYQKIFHVLTQIRRQQQADAKQRKVEDNRSAIWERRRLIIDVAGIIVAAVAAYFLLSQQRTMQGQLDEMRAEQRPWVHSTGMPIVTKFAYLPDGNIYLQMQINMENVGRLPAQDTSGRILAMMSGSVDDKLRNDICARAEWRDVGGIRGVTVFPRERVSEGLFTNLSKDDLTVEKVGNSFAPYIVGCIAYKFPEGDTFHHTPFICVLTLKVSGGIPREGFCTKFR